MSTLARHLNLHTPLIWVISDEPVRVYDEVAAFSDRPVFRQDALLGMLTYKDDRWVQVLVDAGPEEDIPVPTPEAVPPWSFHDTIMWTIERNGVLIMENAHKSAENMLALINHLSERWHRGFGGNDLEKFPSSFVMISHDKEVPPELRRATVSVEYALPDEGELRATAMHVIEEGGLSPLKADRMQRLVRAGLGLTHYEFSHTLSTSLHELGHVDPEFVNVTKMDLLARQGVLELRRPKLTMDDIGGMDRARDLLKRVSWVWNNPARAKEMHLDVLHRILLIGVPGTGKSALCEATATGLGLDLAKFGTGAMMSKWVGESEANMRRAFRQVQAMKPIVLWIDEFGRDMSGSASSNMSDGGTTDRTHAEFLQGIQELPPEVFLVCAANRIEDLPPEMLRADRFDKVLFVGMPTQAERVDIFRIHLGQSAGDYDLKKLAAAAVYFTGAEIKALVREVRFSVGAGEQRTPTDEDFIDHVGKMRGLIWQNHREVIVNLYKRAVNEWEWASSGQQAEANLIIAGPKGKPVTTSSERTVPGLLSDGNLFRS